MKKLKDFILYKLSGLYLYLIVSKEVIDRRKFKKEIYKNQVNNFLLGKTDKFLSKEKITIDIGGATGIMSTYWAPLSKKLIIFEAVRLIYYQTKKLEKQFDNVCVKNIALGNNKGYFPFFVDIKRLSNNSFTDLLSNNLKVYVKMNKLDNYHLKNVGFIKIDVEGFELDVLKGSEKLIDTEKPNLMIEIYEKFSDVDIEETFLFLFNKGYKCFYLTKSKNLEEIKSASSGVKVAKNKNLAKYHDYDFLFTHN